MDEETTPTIISYVVPLRSFLSNKKHSGSVVLTEPGHYVLLWDNTSSWFREKNIQYSVHVTAMERSIQQTCDYNR